MEIISTQKFLRVSPKKLRSVVYLIKKLTPVRSVEVLPFIGKKASDPLRKAIMTAIANAKNKGISDTDLIFKEIQIGEGPRLKRGRAVSRGRWHPYKRRTSHIRVVLETREQKLEKTIEKDKTDKPIEKPDVNLQAKKVKDEPKKEKEIIKEKGKEIKS